MNLNSNPIGIFDSGIGGLTVMAAIGRLLPAESLIYLGDTARVPYGTKSAQTVVRYAKECAHFLVERGVKAIVIACNTASAFALPELANCFDIPILGVVEPGTACALGVSTRKVIGVIGTAGTIASNAYGDALKARSPGVRVVSRACPLFVPLVEEGWMDGSVVESIVDRYLEGMREEGIDTLILGCTHYPLLKDVIGRRLGGGIGLVDSAETTACELERLLKDKGLAATGQSKPVSRIYVTDLPRRFETIARRFLGGDLPPVTRIDL